MGRRAKTSIPVSESTQKGVGRVANPSFHVEIQNTGRKSRAIAEIIGDGTRAPEVAIPGPSMASSTSVLVHANNSTKDRLAEWEKSIQSSGDRRKLSWADEVELQEKQPTQLPSSVWDNFDISKITNAGFKLEYVSPETEGDRKIGEIEAEGH